MPKSVILYAVYFHVRFPVSYRGKSPTGQSGRMDETYVKVKGEWTYLYRAIDKQGNTLDFMLSKRRDEAAATLAGIEVAHMIPKGQFDQSEESGFAQFATLAG
jgi:transposase-like protein